MLIPQFTTRFLLKLTTALAAFSWVLASAVRGQPWAIGVSSALGFVALFLLLSGSSLALVWAAAGLAARRRRGKESTPMQ